jgi:hypothetical protein
MRGAAGAVVRGYGDQDGYICRHRVGKPDLDQYEQPEVPDRVA